MATVITFVDDLTGKTATDTDPVEPVKFSIQGDRYTIDLSKTSEDKLRKALEPFTSKAQLQSSAPSASSSSSGGTSNTAAIRDWYKTLTVKDLEDLAIKGIDMKDRGRVPEAIAAAYDRAHSAS